MNKTILITGAISSGLAVILGAFGAHALEALLIENGRLATYETASQYHFYHSLALLFLGLVGEQLSHQVKKRLYLLLVLGIVVFSGSLYVLSLTNIGVLGAITPIGGLCFILAWGYLAVALFKKT